MSLRTRVGRLEAALAPTLTPPPTDDVDLRAPGQLALAFAGWVASGQLDHAPLAMEILADLQSATDDGARWAAEGSALGLLLGLADGLPPVRRDLWEDLADWYSRNKDRVELLTRQPGADPKCVADFQYALGYGLTLGPKDTRAHEVQARLLRLRDAYGDLPPPQLGGM